MLAFTQKLIEIRKSFPVLYRGRFLTGSYNEELGVKDVSWLTPTGTEMRPENWTDPNARCMGVLLDGRAQATGLRRRRSDTTLLIVLNAHHDLIPFTLVEVPGGEGWQCLLDTNNPAVDQKQQFAFGTEYGATGRSLLLFQLDQHQDYDTARDPRQR